MVIETNFHMGLGIVRGDAFSATRIIPNIPAGVTVTAAALTFKTLNSTADPGVIQKLITSIEQTDIGRIEADGSSGTAQLRFDLTTADTRALTVDTDYYFDIQLTFSNGNVRTLERGITQSSDETTLA